MALFGDADLSRLDDTVMLFLDRCLIQRGYSEHWSRDSGRICSSRSRGLYVACGASRQFLYMYTDLSVFEVGYEEQAGPVGSVPSGT
ncbi:hypothetical protein SAMN05216268_105275 [Streptomyces yunnanensis]|uniref:Uncharacterized protein n=1 Tax=Streptomyces yunnanensis TaxID=156453 RepID=A0A9X8MSF0_9ACTN|nr:hypothetical protein SAMN05216268_105275 [Streptomyces yunnanensis]